MLKTWNINSAKSKKVRIKIGNDGKGKFDSRDKFDSNKVENKEIRDNKII